MTVSPHEPEPSPSTADQELKRLETRIDRLRSVAENLFYGYLLAGVVTLVGSLGPWVNLPRQTIYGAAGIGWIPIGVVLFGALPLVAALRTRHVWAGILGVAMPLGMAAFLVRLAGGLSSYHPFLDVRAREHAKPVWSLYLAIGGCFGVALAALGLAVVALLILLAERALIAKENAVAGEKPGLLRVEHLVKHFPIKAGLFKRTVGQIHAVDGVDLTLLEGETLGLVGESGCGKTTLARTVLKLVEPTGGRIYFSKRGITRFSRRQMREVRRELQIVFQDPYASLNPRMTVRDIVSEPLKIHGLGGRSERGKRVDELLRTVGLSPEHANRFPHEFSGGQRQRIGVARALALNPQLIVLDEPVSALDVSIRAQVINLLESLQQELGLTYLFVAHDLSVVRHFSDRVAVMYLGKIVELGTRDDVYERPSHPYTQALLSAVPIENPTQRGERKRIVLEGDVPSPANPPSGCRFRTRCWKAQPICAEEEPPLIERAEGGHPSACHFAEVMKPLATADRAAS